MKTKHHSFIPMSPELLPRQKLNEVVGLPPRPEGLDVKIEWEHRLKKEHPKEVYVNLRLSAVQNGRGLQPIIGLLTIISTPNANTGFSGTTG